MSATAMPAMSSPNLSSAVVSSSAMSSPAVLAPSPHSRIEDAQAVLVGTLFVALGIVFFAKAGLLTGGTAGVALLVHYMTGVSFGLLFFLINLPFVWLAVRALGWAFTLKSFVAVGLLSVLTELLPRWIDVARLDPLFAAVMGGLLMGMGLLVLFRHHASLGGINVLVLYLQRRRGWRAGKVQMVVDVLIVLASVAVVPLPLIALSIVGSVALNLVVATNHRPERYLGV
jgi:uncharacterized membrane-anchored protein YitT (DUF2179 family)